MATFTRNLTLPQQVILQIVLFCDIPTVKGLRLADRSMRDLIETYQNSISLNASHRFFDQEELEAFKLPDGARPALLSLFALEYRVKTAKRLAAVAVENNQEDEKLRNPGAHGNIGANEVRGDPTRAYVIVGFSVLWRLAAIAREIIHETIKTDVSEPKKRIASLTRGLPFIQQLEAKIKDEQLKYISTLLFRGRESYGYYLMHGATAGTFADRVFHDPKGKTSDWRTGNDYGINNSWLNCLVLREGPGFFAKAWGSREGNEECARFITTEWVRRSKDQLLIEQTATKEVEESLLKYSNALHEAHRYYHLMDWASSGREIERVHTDVTFRLGRRLPAHVIKTKEQDYSNYSL